MSVSLSLLEIFQRTLKFLQLYAPDDPKATQALQAVHEALEVQLDFSGTLEVDVFQSRGRFQLLANGQLMDGPPQAVTSLAQVLMDRHIHRITFERGLDEDELRILFFMLQMKPQRLVELGGPGTFAEEMPHILLNEGVTLTGIPGFGKPPPEATRPEARPIPEPTPPAPISVMTTMPLANVPSELPPPLPLITRPLPPELDPSALEPPLPWERQVPALPSPPAFEAKQVTPAPSTSNLTSASETLRALLGEPLPEAEAPPEEALPIPPQFELKPVPEPVLQPEPEPEEPVPPQLTLQEKFVQLFGPIASQAQARPPKAAAPWAVEQLEALRRAELHFADLSALQGAGERLELSKEDPLEMRAALRQALWSLPPASQGAVLLGIPVFPPGEHALQRAMDYLAPELLAQTVAEVELRLRPPRANLALLVATLLHCVKDRDMSLEALRGRLQFEGWDILDLEALYNDIRWECQGTDTKLGTAVKEGGLLDLEASQIASLCRQAIRGGQLDSFQFFWRSLEDALGSRDLHRKRKAAEVFADLTEFLQDPGIPAGTDTKLRNLLAKHLSSEMDTEALGWTCQGIESLIAHAILDGDLAYACKQVESILDLTVASIGKAGGALVAPVLNDLFLRIAGARNVNALLPLIYRKPTETGAFLLPKLLGLLGQPAARHLVFCLGHEEDRGKRDRLLEALRAIGTKAVVPLREALAAPEWFLVRNVVTLLGEIGDPSAFDDAALTLSHKDLRVQHAAAKALSQMNKTKSVPLLLEALPAADPNFMLELVTILGEIKDARAVAPLVELLQEGKATGPTAERLRHSVLESLGAIGSPEVVPVLQALFKKKGFLSRMEPLPLRMAAAKALAAIGTREARDAMAIAMGTEPKEEVKALLRKHLAGDSGRE